MDVKLRRAGGKLRSSRGRVRLAPKYMYMVEIENCASSGSIGSYAENTSSIPEEKKTQSFEVGGGRGCDHMMKIPVT